VSLLLLQPLLLYLSLLLLLLPFCLHLLLLLLLVVLVPLRSHAPKGSGHRGILVPLLQRQQCWPHGRQLISTVRLGLWLSLLQQVRQLWPLGTWLLVWLLLFCCWVVLHQL
jgi:hypothetical protein